MAAGDEPRTPLPAVPNKTHVVPLSTTAKRQVPFIGKSPLERAEASERRGASLRSVSLNGRGSVGSPSNTRHRRQGSIAEVSELVVGIDGVSRSKREERSSNLKMEILFHLASTSLENLKREFELKCHQSGLPGLPLGDFVEVLRRRLPQHLLQRRADSSTKRLNRMRSLGDVSTDDNDDDDDDDDDDAIVRLCELHADVDADGSGTVEWEEFTRFVMDEGSVADAVSLGAALNSNPAEAADASMLRTADLPSDLGRIQGHISHPVDIAVSLGIPCKSNPYTYGIVERGSFDIGIYGSDSGHSLTTLSGHRGVITAVEGLRDYGYVASAANDCEVKVWDPTARHPDRFLTISTMPESTLSLKWLPWTKQLWTGGIMGTLRSFDVDKITANTRGAGARAPKPEWICENAHDGNILSICEMSHVECVVSAGDDCVIKLWDIQRSDGKSSVAKTELRGHQKGVTSMDFSTAHKTLCSGGFDRMVNLWDPFIRKPVHKIMQGGPVGGVMCPKTHEDWLITVSGDGHLRVYDVRMYKLLHSHICNKRVDWISDESSSRGTRDRLPGLQRTDVTSFAFDERLDRVLMCDGAGAGRSTTLYSFEIDEDPSRIRVRQDEQRKWHEATVEATLGFRTAPTKRDINAKMALINAAASELEAIGNKSHEVDVTKEALGSTYKAFGATTVCALYCETSLNLVSVHPRGCIVYDAVSSLSVRSNRRLALSPEEEDEGSLAKLAGAAQKPRARARRSRRPDSAPRKAGVPKLEPDATKERSEPIEVTCACIDASGRRLLIGDNVGRVSMWAISNLVKLRDCMGHNGHECTGIAYGHRGENSTEPGVYVTCGLDGTVNLSVDDGSDPDVANLLKDNRDSAKSRGRAKGETGDITASPTAKLPLVTTAASSPSKTKSPLPKSPAGTPPNGNLPPSSAAARPSGEELTAEDVMFPNAKRVHVPRNREATSVTVAPVRSNSGRKSANAWMFAAGCRDGYVYVWLNTSPRVRCKLRCSTSGHDEVATVLFCIKPFNLDCHSIVLAAGDTAGTLRVWSNDVFGVDPSGELHRSNGRKSSSSGVPKPDSPATPASRPGFPDCRSLSRSSSRAATSMGFFRNSDELLEAALFPEDLPDDDDDDMADLEDEALAPDWEMSVTSPLERFREKVPASSSPTSHADSPQRRKLGASYCGMSSLAYDCALDRLYIGDDGGYIGAYAIHRSEKALTVERERMFRAHADTVMSLSIINGSEHIMSASFACKAKLWDVGSMHLDGKLGEADEMKNLPGLSVDQLDARLAQAWSFPLSVQRVPKSRLDARDKAQAFQIASAFDSLKLPNRKANALKKAEKWELETFLRVNTFGQPTKFSNAEKAELMAHFGDEYIKKLNDRMEMSTSKRMEREACDARNEELAERERHAREFLEGGQEGLEKPARTKSVKQMSAARDA